MLQTNAADVAEDRDAGHGEKVLIWQKKICSLWSQCSARWVACGDQTDISQKVNTEVSHQWQRLPLLLLLLLYVYLKFFWSHKLLNYCVPDWINDSQWNRFITKDVGRSQWVNLIILNRMFDRLILTESGDWLYVTRLNKIHSFLSTKVFHPRTTANFYHLILNFITNI